MGAPGRRRSDTTDCREDNEITMASANVQREKSRTPLELPDSVAHSLLYSLPREIRDRVYSYCLTATEGAPVEWPRPRDIPSNTDLQPQLLRTCKIIHDEAAPLLYTLNNMTFHHPSDANIFVHAFASSPSYGRHISNLSLHIKAQDMRLWMPYLTSTDPTRSLKSDFPNLKDLSVRFRSTKWQHTHSPDANLRTWDEDSRLIEVIEGLRHVFLSPGTRISEKEFTAYMARNPTALQQEGDNIAFRRELFKLQKARSARGAQAQKVDNAPVVRVVCACRVHSSHFNTLTMPSGIPPYSEGEGAARPVKEGETYRGFTAVDLQAGVKRLHDPDLGSANVARTAYADKYGVLLALEVHCLDSKKDGAEGRT